MIKTSKLVSSALIGISLFATSLSGQELGGEMVKPRGKISHSEFYCDRGVYYTFYDSGDVVQRVENGSRNQVIRVFRVDRGKSYASFKSDGRIIEIGNIKKFGTSLSEIISNYCKSQREIRQMQAEDMGIPN